MSSSGLEVTVTAPGASKDLQKRLERSSLTVVLVDDENHDHTPNEIIAAARADYSTMISVLYDEGYFGPDVEIKIDGKEAATIPPLAAPSEINDVQIIVDTGPQFTFGQADMGPLAPDTDLPEEFAVGETAGTSVLRATARAGIIAWQDAGHAKANIGNENIVADHPKSQLDVDIELLPGPRLDFGALTVTGNEDVRTEAILRIAGYPEGEQFSPEDVKTVTNRLRRTGAFASVQLNEAPTPNADDTLDMELALDEALKRRFAIGAELSSDDGLELTGEWTHRNLFGGAERLTLDATIGTNDGTGDFDGSIKARLDLPAYFGADTSLFYFAGLEYLDEQNYDTLNLFGGAGVRRVFGEYLVGEIGIGPFYSSADDAFGSDRDFQHIRAPFTLTWDHRDDPTGATKGFYLGVNSNPYLGIGSTESGMSTLVDGRSYLSIGRETGLVLAGRVLLGTVVGSSLQGTAPDLLFYSGGVNTVRGQPFDSLGVPVGNGIVGGRSFLGLSGEVRKTVSDAITVVGFYDYGMVGADSYITDSAESHAGAGLGVRYSLSGLGGLRLDVGYPVSGSTGDGLQFYIGIGQAF